ncbi:hypothetical protein V6N13_073398 [Hibiscus sabdariffa]
MISSAMTGKSQGVVAYPSPKSGLDPKRNWVRLIHTLMTCAEAIQQDNLKLTDALVKYIGLLFVSQSKAILEAFATNNRVHLIDFGLKYGM